MTFRNAVSIMPLLFRTFGALNHSIEENGRVELSIDPAGPGPVGWRASFPRLLVGGAPSLLDTATEK